MTTTPWTPNDDQARRLLDDRIDSYDVDPEAMSLWERFVTWLNDVLTFNVDPAGAGSVLLQVLLVAAVVILVFLLLRYFRPAVSPEAQVGNSSLVDPDVSAEQYLADAQRYFAAEELEQAYLHAFRAMVRSADQRQLVEVTPATTATVFGWSLGAVLPTFRTAISEAADEFNSISYGGTVPSRQAITTMLQLAKTVSTTQPGQSSPHTDPARLIPR